MDKKELTEQEIRTRYITPAIRRAGWWREAWQQIADAFAALKQTILDLAVRGLPVPQDPQNELVGHVASRSVLRSLDTPGSGGFCRNSIPMG